MEQLVYQYFQLSHAVYQEWLAHQLWTWRWWLMASMAIVPWIVWIIFRKKQSTWRLLTAGFFVIIISSFLDIGGQALGLWYYEVKVIPLLPPFFPWDTSILPVVTMFSIQVAPRANPFAKAAVYAVGGAFIFQPLMIWLGVYTELHWSHFYSLPLFFVIYLLAYVIATRKSYEKIRPD